MNKNGNNKKILLIFIILILIFLSIILTYNLVFKEKKITRTIMIYMVGADLESKSGLATTDLNGIIHL